jgi:selenocysteine-specific elongation factor
MTVVVGTAGHIDHGKTTLLRALTGIDADRLPEERARGMTIDVGYAHLAFDDGTELDFVDVPGHDKLVGNMLVGAAEIDAALLVIAADDGPRPQTVEHLELLDALGIEDGLVVVTKTDVTGPDRVAAVVAEARHLVAPTRLAGVVVIPVSATTGDGLDALRAELLALRDRVMARPSTTAPDAGSRLAIDRVFSIRGRGTVVTGTLRGGPIERGAILRVVPGTDARTVRVREVQVHGRTVDRGGLGRVALNVAGDAAAGLERGMVLTNDPAVSASDRILVALRPVVAGLARPTARPGSLPADRTRMTLHIGTARVAGSVGRSGRDNVDLGDGEGSAILRLERPIAVAPGDPFVVRRPSPVLTLAGGRVLDPRPARGVARRRATPERLHALAVAPAGSADWRAARLDLHGALEGPPATIAADLAIDLDGALTALAESRPGLRTAELTRPAATLLRRRVGQLTSSAAAGGDGPAQRIVGARLDALVAAGRLVREGDRILPPGVAAGGPSAPLAAAMDRLVAALSVTSPPSLSAAARAAGCPPEGIRLLEQADRIVRLDDDLAWEAATWHDLAARALAMAAVGPLTPAAYRDATGTSRKYVMAILEDLDRRAILRRTVDGHVPGPRASPLAAAIAQPGAVR